MLYVLPSAAVSATAVCRARETTASASGGREADQAAPPPAQDEHADACRRYLCDMRLDDSWVGGGVRPELGIVIRADRLGRLVVLPDVGVQGGDGGGPVAKYLPLSM